MVKKKIYVHQLDETDCGAASLAMIFKAYGSNISISTIRNFCQTDKNGTTALGMVRAAEHFNFLTKVLRLNISFFNKESQKSTPLPFIVHVNKNYGLMHYVVILEIHNDYLLIADPDPTVKTKKVDFEYFANIWTGIAMFMVPNENYHIIKEKQDNLWGVARRLLRYKLTVLKIVALTLFSTIITIAGSIFLQKIVDLFVVEKDINLLNIVTLSLVFAYLFHGIFMYWQGYLSIALGKKLSVDFLLKYMKHLFELPISFFETRRAGEITSRFVDANSIIDTLARTAITTLLNVGTILVIGTVLVFFSPQLFLLSMTVVPVYLILMLSFYRLFDKLNGQCMEKNAQLDSQIIEDLHGIESIKSLYVERKMYGSLRKKFLEALHVNCHFSNMTVLQRSIKDIADLLIELTVLYVGSLMAIRGQITIGKLVAFSSLSGYFLGPIEAIINLQGDLQTARVANKRLNQVMRIEPETKLDKNLVELSENSQTNQIIFSDISFEYKYGQEILHDINLRISRNESTAIVGLSGSGKTTLLKLLVGFYQLSKGTICINNQNIATLKKKSIRTYINYVPQTPYIFSGSVRENIALATKKGIKTESIIRAAKIAEIHDDICKLPDGYDTQLSEGAGLSGGQLQRIAIARSLVSQAKVLIFDESTSNLDLLTEKRIIQNLLKLKGKTLIFIAHRLEIARNVDSIVVMNKGKIVETGNHKELLNHKGEYFELCSK